MVTQHLFVVDSIKWVHLFQSLDVAVFVPMKATWKVELENWPKESHTKNLLKEHFLLLHHGNATILQNYLMIRAAVKKMNVLPVKFARFPGKN